MSEAIPAVIEDRPAWDQADVVTFRNFLGTVAGRKLRSLLNFDEQAQNRAAVVRFEGNHSYMSGYAAGFSARSFTILSLSADLQPQSEEATSPAGAEGFGERNAP